MGQLKFLLLVVLALNVTAVPSDETPDKNKLLLKRMKREKETFFTAKNLETCTITRVLDVKKSPPPDGHVALGEIRGARNLKVIWKVPYKTNKREECDRLGKVYAKFRSIYMKLYRKHPCSKWDMLIRYSIPFFMYPITHNGVKFYAMIAFSRDVRVMLRNSPKKNPISQHNMLEKDDSMLFADRLVNVVNTMHEIDLAFAAIEINMIMEWIYEGNDGAEQKTFVAMGVKSCKPKSELLVKMNWLEVLEAIAEVMGAFDRTGNPEYGKINAENIPYENKVKEWIFQSNEMTKFMTEQLEHVMEHGTLNEKFVETFKTHVKRDQITNLWPSFDHFNNHQVVPFAPFVPPVPATVY